MAGTSTVRAMLVECHPVVRAGLAAVLGAGDICVVADVAACSAAAKALRRYRPDVIVADLENGLTLAGAEQAPPVIVLSFSPAHALVPAIRGGVRGVVGVRASTSQLVAAVKLVAAGGMALSLDAARDLTGMAGQVCSELGSLTARETQLLDLLALGLTTPEIGRRLAVSAKTVRNVVSVVQRKLGVATRAEAIEVGKRAGLGRRERRPDDPLSWLDAVSRDQPG